SAHARGSSRAAATAHPRRRRSARPRRRAARPSPPRYGPSTGGPRRPCVTPLTAGGTVPLAVSGTILAYGMAGWGGHLADSGPGGREGIYGPPVFSLPPDNMSCPSLAGGSGDPGSRTKRPVGRVVA